MTSGALRSDHVNYLIFRYLQEAGHETSAAAFSKDWHRPPEYRDPENYPFAPVVRRHELIHVIQEGLHLDELGGRKQHHGRKFRFTGANARERDRVGLENGTRDSRPGSAAKRKGRPPAMRPPDEFPTPVPKRQRRSEGSEGVHLNGDRDAMEVDAASASADADDDGEAASPAVASEPEMVEIAERYDSMDVAVQTDDRTKTSTMYWKIDKAGANILHSIWNPSRASKHAKTLLAVGELLCRFHEIPVDLEDSQQGLSIDEPRLPPNSVVTAVAWHPDGDTAVLAIDGLRESPDGEEVQNHMPHQMVLSHNRELGISRRLGMPPLHEPTSIVLALKYSDSGDRLSVVRTNLKNGTVIVYDTSKPDAASIEPIAWLVFEDQVLDVSWLQNDRFIVCGDNGVAEIYWIDDGSLVLDGSVKDGVSMPALGGEISLVNGPALRWDKVRFDERTLTIALASSGDRKLCIRHGIYNHLKRTVEYSSSDLFHLPGQLTAMAFDPVDESRREIHKAGLLATAFEDGTFVIYSCNPAHDDYPAKMTEQVALQLVHGPALALAWSHDGAHLAIGGIDVVQIWATSSLVEEDLDDETKLKATDGPHEPLVTWRPDSAATGPRNGEHDEDRPLSEPSLSWSSDGESLAFAVDKQVSSYQHLRRDHVANVVFRSPSQDSGRLFMGRVRMEE